uniref:Uncharacterized protein n=1 Tax=Wuchereria bancrofti TaxID=6293 RepID=A0A1I8EXD2_WUCBA
MEMEMKDETDETNHSNNIHKSISKIILSGIVMLAVALSWALSTQFTKSIWLISVAAAIIGVTVISLDKEFVGSISLSVLSALSAALYKVLFKKVFGDATIEQVSLFMSGLGLLNVSLNSLPMIILLINGVETFTWSDVPWV